METGYSAKVILDSVSPDGSRLITMEVRYPRFVHAEMMTHRMFSRNAASSRAIPISKMIEAVERDPARPIWWGKNQAGMAAREELTGAELKVCQELWNEARYDAIAYARGLAERGLHKQIANRLLEPFSWITVIITATEWENFFTQRCHPDAQPEIRLIAEKMLLEIRKSDPNEIRLNGWHLPYIQQQETACVADFDVRKARKVSVARCARVSYLTHDGKPDIEKDLQLYDRLVNGGSNGHWSPFEHVATPSDPGRANFRGWRSYRTFFPQENAVGDYAAHSLTPTQVVP